MIISNADVHGRRQNIVIENGKIVSVGAVFSGTPDIDAKGKKVIPGLIDVHVHGCMGFDATDGELAPICDYLARHGTTSFLPTTMTMDEESLKKATSADTRQKGANILGFHLEGPFIAESRKGAQKKEYIRNPSVDEFNRYKNVAMITVAPEKQGCIEFIDEVKDRCVVSIGHTDCDYDTAEAALKHGAKCLTHIYNAMPPFSHRAPGPIGAALLNGAFVQMICDGIHVHKSVALATYRMFGADRTVLISDSIRPTGLCDGEYVCGGMRVTLKDGVALIDDGHIAGSTTTLFECVRRAADFGIPFDDAVKMATETPSKLIGAINKGKIEAGRDADMLILDDNLNIETVIIGGEIYR